MKADISFAAWSSQLEFLLQWSPCEHIFNQQLRRKKSHLLSARSFFFRAASRFWSCSSSLSQSCFYKGEEINIKDMFSILFTFHRFNFWSSDWYVRVDRVDRTILHQGWSWGEVSDRLCGSRCHTNHIVRSTKKMWTDVNSNMGN